VNNTAVGLGDPEAQLGLFFKKNDIQPVLGKLAGEGSAYNTAANDEDVRFQIFPFPTWKRWLAKSKTLIATPATSGTPSTRVFCYSNPAKDKRTIALNCKDN
jgi:hypothetical protein